MGTRLTLEEINKQLAKDNLSPELRKALLKKKKELSNDKDIKK
jgi:hypothetical protein